jgi:ADP-ribose pyrophosphatase YjhB (NUDIX family)
MTRYCIKCGQTAAQQNKDLYTCPSGHENWLNPVPGATVYITRNDEVAFGIRSLEPGLGKMCVPGGFIEVGETAEQAATREAKEEMGVDVQIAACLGTYLSEYFGRQLLNIVFVGTIGDQTITPGDDLGGGEAVWRKMDDLPPISHQSFDWYDLAQADLLKWWHNQPK